MSDDTREFAYGSNSFQGRDCPTVVAGFSPEEIGMAVEQYDNYLRAFHLEKRGVVGEETAKEAWLAMIDSLEAQYDPDCLDSLRRELTHKKARKVARELGWMKADK